MAGMIRLRPTQIILTGEEVNKTLRKPYPTAPKSRTSPVPLQWDHNVTFRKGRGSMMTEKSPYFNIHEDSTSATPSEADAGDEISEMSDFSFGPILLDINPSDTNSVLVEANSSSEAGDVGSGEDSGKSAAVSWDGEYSTNMDTPTNISTDDEALVPSIVLSGSNFLLAGQQDTVWEIYSDAPAEHEPNGTHDSLNDIDYQADVELSIEDDAISEQDSDAENRAQESYSLPLDGATEHKLGEKFAGLDLYASPTSSSREKESPSGRILGLLEIPSSSVTITPTPPPVRRLLNETPPRLEDAIGLSPRHAALQRAALARCHSSRLKNQVPAKSPIIQEGNNDFQLPRSFSRRQSYSRNLSHRGIESYRFSEATPILVNEPENSILGSDDSDGGIQIPENNPKVVVITNDNDDKDNASFSDGGKEDTARRLDG